MKTLMMGMLLLLGACAVSEESPAPSPYGGNISSPAGRAWLAAIEGRLYNVIIKPDNSGFDANPNEPAKTSSDGDVKSADRIYTFAGALSPTRAFYFAPKVVLNGEVVQEAGTKLEGFFISNVQTASGAKTLVYAAALKLTQAEINTVKAQLEIIGNVDQATLAQKREYYRIVHALNNFDFEEPEPSTGYEGKNPLWIVDTP